MLFLEITIKDILDNLDKPWDWFWVSQNPNITMKDILDNLDKPWNWSGISGNPSITMKYINDNPDKRWSWSTMSLNIFTKDKAEFIEQKYREHLATILIQNAYKNALVNPNCQLGLNRIERDMDFAGVV